MSLHIIKDKINKQGKTVVIVHGIAEHSGRYKKVAKALNDNGYNVIRYDLRGHGLSSGSRGKIKSFHNHIDDLHLIVSDNRNNDKIFLLGHSMGGLIVNLYAAKYGNVDGIISSGGANLTPKDAKILKYIGFWYLRWAKINSKRFDQGLSRDANVLKMKKDDILNLKYIYISLIGEMFVKGIKYLHQNINKITQPLLYLHGENDPIVTKEASIYMSKKIPSNDKTLKIYEGALHEILNEINQEEVINDIINWLDKH